MTTMRAQAERNVLPQVGARFFREGDEIMFEFVIDPSNIIGPRPATRIDQGRHAEAWEAFRLAEGVSALDRDADGEDGGSLAVESQPAVQEPTAPATPRRGRRKAAE